MTRNSHKLLEKDLNQLNLNFNKLNNLVSSHGNGNDNDNNNNNDISISDNSEYRSLIKVINNLFNSLELKIKNMNELQSEELNKLNIRRDHIKYSLLNGFYNQDQNLVDDFKSKRLFRWIIDWCLRNNNLNLAQSLSNNLQINVT